MRNPKGILVGAALFAAALSAAFVQPAQAGVFNIPRFIEPDHWSLGVEPELTLTNGAGMAGNAKFSYGLSSLLNATATLGTGGGARQFRAGAAVTFDFIPDIDKQPGIGVAGQMHYYRLKYHGTDRGQFETTAVPYIHKAFQLKSGAGEVDPFVAVPFGVGFMSDETHGLAHFVIGSMFKNSEKFRYVVELGVAVENTESYFSGGIIYYH